MNDPREPVYRKKGKRYVAFASLDDGWHKFDPWHHEGLWLHTRDDCSTRQCLIATIDELPSSAVGFASVMIHQEELTKKIVEWRSEPISANDLATKVLEWIHEKSNEPVGLKQ